MEYLDLSWVEMEKEMEPHIVDRMVVALFKSTEDSQGICCFHILSISTSLALGNYILPFFWGLNCLLFSVPGSGCGHMTTAGPSGARELKTKVVCFLLCVCVLLLLYVCFCF
jgi:hypothetical protein